MKFGVLEWVKRNTLRWFGHMERKKSEKFVNKVYMSETVDPRRRGRAVVRWKDRVKEYMHEELLIEGKGFELARRECGYEEVEAVLPWPSYWRTLLEGMKHQAL